MLQSRVNELQSGIINVLENKVRMIGFMSEKMLNVHLHENKKNWSSHGLYDKEDIVFHNIQDDALFIVMENDVEVGRYQYKPVYRSTLRFKNELGKSSSLTYTIRKSQYSNHYHFKTEKLSLLFNNKDELAYFLSKNFKVKLEGEL